jgi:hypothetical protein
MNLYGKVKCFTDIQHKRQLTKFSFNEKGFLIEELTDFEHDGSVDQWLIYKYDSLDKLISIKKYWQDSIISSIYTFTYDVKGNKVEENIENVNDEIKEHNARYSYKYDDYDNCIEMSGFNRKGELFTKYIYKYDSIGNKIEEIWLEANGDIIGTYKYMYDSNGNKIEEYNKYTSSNKEYKTTYKYNSQGVMIEENFDDGEAIIIYRLDNYNNWIKKTFSENNELSIISEREFEYY